jgi:uncharacterized protein
MLWTVVLLIASNVFMTFAWYGHLREHRASPLPLVILVSWGIAFLEYCFQVPANRLGAAQGMSTTQLKTIQEIVTLVVFVAFAKFYMGDAIRWNHIIGLSFVGIGAVFVFRPW